jgi:hypothetical protein
MRSVLTALGRAILSQLRPRMLLLTFLPFLASLVLWGVVLAFGLNPLIDWLHRYFAEHGWFHWTGAALSSIGAGALKTVLVPLLAMWLLLPLMILTALLFVGLGAMPVIARHVSGRHYPDLERRRGGSLAGSLATSLLAFLVFALLWLLALPLYLFPPLALLVQPVLWGWLTCRVMAYDALSEHASRDERRRIMRQERWPLLGIGVATGALGAAPTLLWLGGVLSVVFFPLLAAVSIWLYVLVFVFSGLWFQHYCLAALARLRHAPDLPDA